MIPKYDTFHPIEMHQVWNWLRGIYACMGISYYAITGPLSPCVHRMSFRHTPEKISFAHANPPPPPPPPLTHTRTQFPSTSLIWRINLINFTRARDVNNLNIPKLFSCRGVRRVGGSYLSVCWSGRKFHLIGFWCALLSWHPDPILTHELMCTCGSVCVRVPVQVCACVCVCKMEEQARGKVEDDRETDGRKGIIWQRKLAFYKENVTTEVWLVILIERNKCDWPIVAVGTGYGWLSGRGSLHQWRAKSPPSGLVHV